MSTILEYVERARKHGANDADNDMERGEVKRVDDDIESSLADTESLIHAVTGMKLHEFEESDENASSMIYVIIETYEESYIDTCLAGGAYEQSDQ